jgi:hypothetical protein
MMFALVLAVVVSGADGGSGSVMFDQALPTKKAEATKKVEKPGFTGAVVKAGENLSKVFTEKLGVETKVQSIMVSPKEGAEGPLAEVDMAVITFTNAKETFSLLFIGADGKLQLLPRDFKVP